MRIKALSGDKPHPDWGGWWRFLQTQCEVRDTYRGVTFYGATNCNYIVFPCGTLVQNYGYHGRVLMSRVREIGPTRVLIKILQDRKAYKSALKQYCTALDNWIASLQRGLDLRRRQRELAKQ